MFVFRSLCKIVLVSFSLLGVCNAEMFDEKELEDRVKERWSAIVEHDFDGAYQYATPTYKSVFAKDLYVSQFSRSVDWNLTKIDDVKYDPATGVATVLVLVETKSKNSKGLGAGASDVSVEIREKWLHIKGQWWHSSSE